MAESARPAGWGSRHSIGARLLAGVLLFSGSVTLVLTAIQLYIDYRRDVSTIDSRLNQISGSYLDSLAEGLWNLDERQLRLQLSGILRLPDIRAAEVREAGTTGNALVVKLGNNSESSVFARDYPLRYKAQGQDKVIGTLHVEATLADVYRRLADTALTILVSQAAKTFLVSLFILYLFQYLVTRHLSAIAAFVGSYRIDGSPSELRLRRRPPRYEDELQRVVTAFNTLSHDLQIAYRDLREVNEQLARDAAARRQAEAVLREREARIRRLVEADIIGVFIWDFDGRIIEANDAFLQIVGYEHEDLVAGRVRWTDLTPPEWHERDAQWVDEHKRTGLRPPIEKEYFRKDGSRVPILLGAATFEDGGSQGVAFVLDLTDRKRAEAERERLEERLRQSQKMEAIGTLAGGIAHDFNNILGAILGYSELAQRKVREGGALGDELDQVMQAGQRGKRLVEHILAFSRGGAGHRGAVHVQSVVAEALTLLAASLPQGVRLEQTLGAGDAAVLGDATQLHQVTMNLCTNAVQAMALGGVVTVTLDRVEVAQQRPLSHGVLEPGVYVRLAVSDTGSGIPRAALERIFDPFFTTKGVGKGTGLGLSLVHGIVAETHGAIDVTTREGKGTTFTAWLPCSGETAVPLTEDFAELPHGNGESVMVVDDEKPLLRLAEETLAQLGYDPAGFDSSVAALEAFRADPQRYDLALTDQTMPDLTGTELAQEIRRLRPELPIVLMSGYKGPQLSELAQAAGISEILHKPLVSRDIAAALAKVKPDRNSQT